MNFNATLDYLYTLVNRQPSQMSSLLLLVLCLAFAIDMGGEFGIRNPAVAFLVPILFMLNGFAVPRVAILAMPILVIYPLALLLIALNSDADATIAFSQFKSTAFGWVLLFTLSGISAKRILFSVFSSLTCAAGIVVILFFGVWENVPLALTAVKHLSSFTPSLISEGGKLMGGVIVPAIYLKSTLFLLPACIYWLYRERMFLAFVCFLGLIVSCSKVGLVLGAAVFIIFIITNTAYRNKFLILSGLILGLFVANKMGYFEVIASLLNSSTVQTVQTVQIRLGHFYSFKDYFLQYPVKFLFGFGLGKAMYSEGANSFVYNTELDHLNLIWRYGFIWSCIFVFGILRACSKSIFSKNVQSRIFGIVCLAAFLVAGTNPVLLTPIFFLILTSLVYSFPNRNHYRLNLWHLKRVYWMIFPMQFSKPAMAIIRKLRAFQKKLLARKLPLSGYKPGLNSHVDALSDEDLIELNGLLDWNSFISDANGRRFGMAAWCTKRVEPQEIPDKRIVAMHERFNLSGQHVLEVGCFEGVHTLGLLQYAGKVTAVDSRVDHVVKTMVRCGMHGQNPTVFRCDVESESNDYSLLSCDFIHHVGVLYHLRDPISHLLSFKKFVRKGVMLETHYSLPKDTKDSYNVGEREYSYKRYMEYGKKESFSGMYDHSKWLLLDDIVDCLKQSGFDHVEIVEKRAERNGPRVLLYASKVKTAQVN